MANDPLKNLETLKLRQRIKELENKATQNKTKHSEELLSLTKENENLQRQHDIEIKSKIRQLNQNNKNLMEELVDARKSQCKAEEEIITVTEKNVQLTYDFKNVQEKYEKCRSEIGEISMDTVKKEQQLQKVSAELNKYKQKNVKLQEEIESLSSYCNKAKADIRKKDSEILQLTKCMEESNKNSLQQEALEKTIQKLQAKNSTLQSEIQETDTNRNNISQIRLKNKQFLTENMKIKAENEKLVIEKSTLEKQLIQNKKYTETIQQALEAAQKEIFEINEKTLRLDTELQNASLAMTDKDEVMNQKYELEKVNLFLKKKSENQQAEIEKHNQGIITLENEISKLKQRIHDLEASNFKKLQIIAKLKDGNDYSYM